MIRKEAVQLPAPDPAGLRRLATFRAQLGALDAEVSSAAQRQREFAQRRASQVREHKFDELTRRMHAADDGRRPSDRDFAVRPLTHLDSDLWEFQNIRQWFSGADATLRNSLRDPALLAAGAPSGPSLVASGYLRPVDRAGLDAARASRRLLRALPREARQARHPFLESELHQQALYRQAGLLQRPLGRHARDEGQLPGRPHRVGCAAGADEEVRGGEERGQAKAAAKK